MDCTQLDCWQAIFRMLSGFFRCRQFQMYTWKMHWDIITCRPSIGKKTIKCIRNSRCMFAAVYVDSVNNDPRILQTLSFHCNHSDVERVNLPVARCHIFQSILSLKMQLLSDVEGRIILLSACMRFIVNQVCLLCRYTGHRVSWHVCSISQTKKLRSRVAIKSRSTGSLFIEVQFSSVDR